MRHRSFNGTLHVLFDRFLLLPIGAAIALVWANTAPVSYFTLSLRLAFVVNEIGMAFFFALMAQEIAEAVMRGGALHSWRRWMLPIVAALGGIAGAVTVYLGYLYFHYEYALTAAWPIACAVDAAATYYVLRAILPHNSAVPFALLLAIVTDAIGLAIVAPRHLILEARVGGAGLMLVAFGLAAALRAMKVRAFWPYLFVCGALSWVAFDWEGLHPAFALIPIVPFLPHEPRHTDLFADPPDDDAVHRSEHEWHLIVQPVLFLFGLVNAGVVLKDYDTGSWAMLSAQLIGRPAGILLAVGLALASGLHLPGHMSWRELLVVAFATSAGFSVALFLATGVLATGPVLAQAKIGVLASAAGLGIALVAARVLRVGRLAH
ncbi:MAG TPA: Na+/H+ antiporter NhaA [Vicinamibacterales bacterium]|nr:Na+/H+ antiporter NhaA [Vicinamibacterales bacterium]